MEGATLRLQRDTRYAIAALLELGRGEPGSFLDARDIAARGDLPLAYLHKILRRLTTARIVVSRRGSGYALARPLAEITMRDVLAATEGDEPPEGRCIFWRESCAPADPCPLHFRWVEIRPAIDESIGGTTLAEVAAATAG